MSSATNGETIFVQIASYRDPDCQWTIKDLFEYAAKPERIFVGVCWQIVPEADQDCFLEKTRPGQVRSLEYHVRDSRGVCWARHQVQKLWRGEDYAMQIDSHMRFEPAWDETLIRMLRECSGGRAVLTTYPMGFKRPREPIRGWIPKPNAKEFDQHGVLIFGSNTYLETDELPKPMPHAFLAGGFVFGPSSIIADVPYDPYVYFIGEECSMAARLWTHGYDLYAPNHPILYHDYDRHEKPRHWSDDKDWGRFNQRSVARLRHLFGTQRSTDSESLRELDRYGFGQARSLQDYERFTGISFKNRTVSESAKSIYFPYLDKETALAALKGIPVAPPPHGTPARATTTSRLERDGVVARASAQGQLRFKLTTKYTGPQVPAQLTDGRGGQIERRSIQRELQSIATELMFGAQPQGLIERLIALGAPAKEAHRIIETADSDPLIANGRAMALVLRRRDWLLETLERQQRLWPAAAQIERRGSLNGDEFLERYYSRGRPVILTGGMRDWPAVAKWNAEYLASTIGGFEIGYQAATNRGANANETRGGRMPFDEFVRMISQPESVRGGYMLADELSHNVAIAGWLKSDLGFLSSFLDVEAPASGGTLWIGSSNLLTPLHHDLVNCLVAQIAGRNRFKIVAAGQVDRLYNHLHGLSEIKDLEAPDFDVARYPRLAGARIHDVTLEPGEILYLPLAWWYQVRSSGFGASITYTNFKWPNDFYSDYPTR